MLLRTLLVFLWLSLLAIAQTVPRLDQISGTPPASSPEASWCPGPPLERLDAATIAIGRQWTAATPCFGHFNLTPPAAIDPISVSTFTTGATVTLVPNATFTDDLYVYLQAPLFSASAVTRPQRIMVQTRYPTQITCTGCTVETAGTGTRMFPAFSLPVGLVSVAAGTVHPALDPIINSHQLYIGADLGVAVRRDGAGIWIELSRVEAQAQATVAQAQLAAGSLAVAQARVLASQPLPVQRLDTLEKKFEDLYRDYFAVVERIPASQDQVAEIANAISDARIAAEQAGQQASTMLDNLQMQLSMQLNQLQEQSFAQLIANIDREAKLGKPCVSTGPMFGMDGRQAVVCDNSIWRRLQTKSR